jgi:hypothetical protein
MWIIMIKNFRAFISLQGISRAHVQTGMLYVITEVLKAVVWRVVSSGIYRTAWRCIPGDTTLHARWYAATSDHLPISLYATWNNLCGLHPVVCSIPVWNGPSTQHKSDFKTKTKQALLYLYGLLIMRRCKLHVSTSFRSS